MKGKLVGTAVAAEALGLSTDRIVGLIEDGTIRGAIRPVAGGHYRIPVAEVERLVEEAERRVAG